MISQHDRNLWFQKIPIPHHGGNWKFQGGGGQRPRKFHRGRSSTLMQPSVPDTKYYLAKFRHTQKAKFHFHYSLFFHFSCLILFSFAGHLVGFIFLVGKVFRKVFRVLRLDERNEGGDFHGNFHVNVTRCFDFFPGVLD